MSIRAPAIPLRAAIWPQDEPAIAHVRRAVFIEEQGVPEALEWEAQDALCHWFVAEEAGQVVGIVRLTPQGRIGRMAVLPTRRGCGTGSALLQLALTAAHTLGLREVNLSAQTHALTFYARHGFVAHGPVFDDAGIPHRKMSLKLKETP